MNISKERLDKIASWREKYGANANVTIPAAEAEEMARYILELQKQVPVAWTDEEELRDMKRDGYGAMLSVTNKAPGIDPRRQIMLYAAPVPPAASRPLAEQAAIVERHLDELGVGSGDYADNAQLRLWGRVYAYGGKASQPPAVPDEIKPEDVPDKLPTANLDEYECCVGADMWNACRAAMLQLAK